MAAVELYSDSNFRRKLVQTNSDTPNVGNDVNDRVTSIVINEGTWRFFIDSQYRGVSTDFGPGRYPNIGLGTIPNDSITSFRRIG
ncbi:MAG: beta/gamma crystallin family protein [Limnoraphis sp. WC205]|nr:beta/gamma crystallin family protein [Limnoraphis sp. WC205]